MGACMDEPAEILVFRQQESLRAIREIDDDLVDGPRRDFGDGLHVEASHTQHADDTEVTALVGEEAHAARVRQSRAVSG